MNILLIVCFLFNGFYLKWNIPQGTTGPSGRVIVEDTDRDLNQEFIICRSGGSQKIYIYELHLPDIWEMDSFSYYWGPLVWDIGDFDQDGFYDLVIQTAVDTPPVILISIAESPDSFSYPTTEVWRDTVGPPLTVSTTVYDIDQDGLPEIIKNRATPYGDIGIYEAVGNNQYELIFADNPDTSGLAAPAATHACADFDQDNHIECVFAGGDECYWIYESPSNNTYEKVNEGTVPTLNVRDCVAVPDADGDSKWEFVIKGYVIPSSEIDVFILEAISDNTYEVIDTLILPGGDYYGGYSAVGDVDADSVPEIVLEARQNVFVIKAAGNDSFYVWDTLPGNASGSSIAVYDIDGNGYKEIVISGNDETRIYEYEAGAVHEATAKQISSDIIHASIFAGPFQLPVDLDYKLFDITGRQIHTINPAPGIYFIEVDGEITQKVIKIK